MTRKLRFLVDDRLGLLRKSVDGGLVGDVGQNIC